MATSAVSKAALVYLTGVLDLELRPLGIRVNAVAPAMIDNAKNRPYLPPDLLAHAVAPGAIADIIVHLVSDAAAPVSGAAIRYSPMALSVPENSSTNRSGSGWPLREITARRRPAAQPSVRSYNAAARERDRLISETASSSRASLAVNFRSPARSSATSSASLSWCSLIGGSRARRLHHAQISEER